MTNIIECLDCGEQKKHHAKRLCHACYNRQYYMGGIIVKERIEIDHEWLRKKYWDKGLSAAKIARLIGCCEVTIWNRLKKYGIGTRTRSEAKRGKRHPCWGKRGPEHNTWKGGRLVRPDGYILIWQPDHPYARYVTKTSGYVLEHRLVVEKALGRYLKPNELVHHINGIRDDNRLENLELIDHHRRRICPRCGWPMNNLICKATDELD